MTSAPIPNRVEQLMLDYMDGRLTGEGRADLVAAIKSVPGAAQDCLELMRLVTMVRELCRLDTAARKELILSAEPEQNIQELIAALMPPEDLPPVDFVEVIRRGLNGKEPVDLKLVKASPDARLGRVLIDEIKLTPKRWGIGPIAALLAIGVLLAIVFRGGSDTSHETAAVPDAPIATESNQYVAVLTDAKNARWESAVGETAPSPGDKLEAGRTLVLTNGFASIRTNQGAVAILEAPCTVRTAEDDNTLHLSAGKLVGVVENESAKGFRVLTPSATIVDLGTRFGVVYDGTTRMRVLEGEISVTATQAGADAIPMRLQEGSGAVVDLEEGEITRDDAISDHFASSWRAIRSQPILAGEVRFESAFPKSLLYGGFEHERIVMFAEQAGVQLKEDLTVTIDQPGRHVELNKLTATLASGTRVDSYLLHLDLPGEVPAKSHRSATITFDQPILAVLSNSAHLASSDAALGLEGVLYKQGNKAEKFGGVRGMEPATSELEAITISEDRKTLTVDMILFGASIDQARVLVQAKGELN